MATEKAPAKRRSAKNGGKPATRRKAKPGNAGYLGYEYQITVTVWVALDLMLVKGSTTEIAVEPPSDEDIEAAVNKPDVSLLEASASADGIDLIIQAKTRSGSPWSATAFADVLLGKKPVVDGSGRKRSRPLEMLEAEPRRHYLFITNESVAEALRPHTGEHLFDFSDVEQLPPYSRVGRDAAAQAPLAPRVLILDGLTEEVLVGRIAIQLERHAHVARPAQKSCVRDLRDLVRKKIKGHGEGRMTRAEIVDVLVRHGGSIASRRVKDNYVRPSSYDAIKRKLDESHAVVIAGPSGTGKTLTADILEAELRFGEPPFSVIGEEHGPSQVKANLDRFDPIVFHLRDPWGGNRLTPDADRWSGELPKLLADRGPGRKFIVTSRSDVLDSAGQQIVRALKPFVETIELEDYNPDSLREIYDRIASDHSGHARVLAAAYRDVALDRLGRPYEISRFLISLGDEQPNAPRPVSEIIADAQIEAISKVIADQIAPLGADSVESAAVIWAMLVARNAVPDAVFRQVIRRIRSANPNFRPDVQGLVDFLIAGQNLKRDGSAISFTHPRVEDGLRLAMLRRSNDAEFALGRLVEALIDWDQEERDWGAETGLIILRTVDRIPELEVDLAADASAKLDGYLVAATLAADQRRDFEMALRDLANFGSAEHVPSRLARALVDGAVVSELSGFGPKWTVPTLSSEEVAELRDNPATEPLTTRFVREVLPFTQTFYPGDVVPFLASISPDLENAYWDALDTVAGPTGPSSNIGPIVRGALAGKAPDYERAIERFGRSEDEADEWMERSAEQRRSAEEHVLDADAVDHVLEEPAERYHNASSGLEKIVALRRKREGVAFIRGHPREQLLARALSQRLRNATSTVAAEELHLLVEVSEGWTREYAWEAIERHWKSELEPALVTELRRTDLDRASLRKRLIKTASKARPVDLVGLLAEAAAETTPERRLEIVHDLMATRIDDDPRGAAGLKATRERARELLEHYPDAERSVASAFADVLAGGEVGEISTALSQADAEIVAERLPGVSVDVAGPLSLLAASAGIDVRAAVSRLLATDDAEDGEIALQSLQMSEPIDYRALLEGALKHPRYKVRREAFELLVPDASTGEERTRLVAAANDESAEVRLAFARTMASHRWPEALPALTKLLSDDRNYNSQLAMGARWSRFAVARAAASALAGYDAIPQDSVDRLIEVAETPSRDPFVAFAAYSALATRRDERITPLLLAAVGSAGMSDHPYHRPQAQAAAWAIYDRALSGALAGLGSAATSAIEDAPPIAGPLLMAAGFTHGPERQALLMELERLGRTDAASLVRLAAVLAERSDGLTLDDQECILAGVAPEGTLDGLDGPSRSRLEEWSMGLDQRQGVQRYVAWLAGEALGLPLDHDPGDVRSLELPGVVPVMTMRSLTPHREELGPDGGS